ncbi:MAG: hypothetical protein F6K58_28945 [Symploca sp. SIO2E9]|nr:hypothetical protein [Symploca sp. SIO2E9]
MKPKFSTLIILIWVATIILAPFAFSEFYLPLIRDHFFKFNEILRGDWYKQTTGFILLSLVLFEVVLAVRKRSRKWKIVIPGSMKLWRSLHIFLGIGLLGMVLIHTGGSTGENYNAIFLWVFFGVSLSALVGVVAETGIVESPRKEFSLVPAVTSDVGKFLPIYSKGVLVRGLRLIWLSIHIFLVSIFVIMLGFHIFLAYFFQ